MRDTFRHLVALTYLTQAVMALTGALNLWLAIHFWLVDSPFMSALMTTAGFYTGHLFVRDSAQRRYMREAMKTEGKPDEHR